MRFMKTLLLPFARRYVAGETVDSAIAHVRALNDAGVSALVNHLGEHIDDVTEADAARDEYLRVLDRLDAAGVDAAVSLKLTHLGLHLSQETAVAHLEEIVERAATDDRFVWIDMETASDVDDTLAVYEQLRPEYDNLGICLQAYLERSSEDLARLLANDFSPAVRVVKGAYEEDESLLITDREAVRDQFRAMVGTLLDSDAYIAVATHDPVLIDDAGELIAETDRSEEDYEFQFLMGVRSDTMREMANNHHVAEYVPYGADWPAYYLRRVKERYAFL